MGEINGRNEIREIPTPKPTEANISEADADKKLEKLFKFDGCKDYQKPDLEPNQTYYFHGERYDRIPKSHGEWKGREGDSRFVPAPNDIPPEKRGNTITNEGNLTNKQIAEKYGVNPKEGYLYEKGDLNLDDVSKGTVEIEGMSENRYTKHGQEGNFEKADRKLAEQRGCSPDEIAKWRAENNYTYHERQDCRTMQKVPNEIHGNLPHRGGVSVIKERNNTEEGIFDE